ISLLFFLPAVSALGESTISEQVALATPLLRARWSGGGWRVRTPAGEFSCGRIVNCAGGWAARVAAACGHPPGVVVVPVRGTYREVARPGLVRGLIYPVPDPRLPFLGVHFTKGPDGRLWVGPDAMLALAPHGGRPSLPDLRETLGRRAYWLFMARHLALGAGMVWRASRPGALAAAARRLVPSFRDADLGRRRWGVRAQAIDRAGRLVDDFVLARGRGAVHLLNAPSPGATSCLALAREVESACVGEP
ncbi:FAD-dependent oxidoreductase, partial [bacterium]|nr:FAD-dependent oxidoreductase [bacterium]